MSIASTIAWARRRQADQFTQACTIRRPVGEPAYDPDLGESVQEVVVLYTGLPCKVTVPDRSGTDREAAQTKVRLLDPEIKLPVGTDVAMNDLVEITASVFHALSVGKHYRIVETDEREWQVSRRCVIEETVVPRLWEGS